MFYRAGDTLKLSQIVRTWKALPWIFSLWSGSALAWWFTEPRGRISVLLAPLDLDSVKSPGPVLLPCGYNFLSRKVLAQDKKIKGLTVSVGDCCSAGNFWVWPPIKGHPCWLWYLEILHCMEMFHGFETSLALCRRPLGLAVTAGTPSFSFF